MFDFFLAFVNNKEKLFFVDKDKKPDKAFFSFLRIIKIKVFLFFYDKDKKLPCFFCLTPTNDKC